MPVVDEGYNITTTRRYEGVIEGYPDPVPYEPFDHPSADEEVLGVFQQNYDPSTLVEVRQINWFDPVANLVTNRVIFSRGA